MGRLESFRIYNNANFSEDTSHPIYAFEIPSLMPDSSAILATLRYVDREKFASL